MSLHNLLQRLDGANYKAYNDLKGRHTFDEFVLIFDRIQGDPFASPSQCRVIVSNFVAQFPPDLFSDSICEIALRDYLTREFAIHAKQLQSKCGSGNSGKISIIPTGQCVLERSSAWINHQEVEIRFSIGLPAHGRRIAGREAIELLCETLPKLVDRALKYKSLDAEDIQNHIETVEDAEYLREQLDENDLVAFIANHSILPRQSGVDDRPLKQNAIPLISPPYLEVELTCPNSGIVTGMGIPKGVTLIVGGGFHGKSTLLHSIERGIYNHIPGDGRAYIVTDPTAVRIRAEEGRSITNLDISPFINHLPFDRSTTNFSTSNASGSTSQAANILEAIISGSKLLLLDEDTCATNFMIRDRRMQQLIHKSKEPITPFLDRIRQLYDEHGISTILVMGGCGDYLDVADQVIAMESFQAYDITNEAIEVAIAYKTDRTIEVTDSFTYTHKRQLQPGFLDDLDRSDRCKIRVNSTDDVSIGDCKIDLSQIEQLEESGQLKTIAQILTQLDRHLDSHEPLQPQIQGWSRANLDALTPVPQGDLVRVRGIEVAAAIDRIRRESF